ncbi:TPA: ribonuclease HI [Candidatus Delongbacteria bacterium]|nr:MAG: ribonuclease HI [Candidatus Delongbacteria bacterium GWF2_40_14]HAQ60851.1 ribonuclease HI [Candidatus Delongbacteria bacterium]
MKQVTIYADGACSKNPGPGGWGTVLIYEDKIKKLSGFHEMSTNNIMELTAVIQGLKALKEKCRIEVFTDSKYIVDSVTKWLPGWKRNGWITSSKKQVKNIDLWQELTSLSDLHEVSWNWVKGHNGNLYNEECDKMAKDQIESNKKSKPENDQ